MSGWQPIETAPKDGTPVILAASHGVSVGWWEDAEPTFKWRFVDDFDLTPTGCCNMESDDRVPCNGMYADAPTHWQPLPEPPERDEAPFLQGGWVMADAIPQWAMRAFCDRANLAHDLIMADKSSVAVTLRSAIRAGAQLIAQHEQPPVDPLIGELMRAVGAEYATDSLRAELAIRGLKIVEQSA